MSLHTALRASARIFLGVVIVAAALPLTVGDAEARRGRASVASSADTTSRTPAKTSEEQPSEAPASSTHAAPDAVDATAETSAGSAAEPVRAQVVTTAKPLKKAAPKDADVPGCTTGMLCIVCLAGCNNTVNSIVHSVPKQR